ncbi:hypothetical protein SERLA73DRAFT_127012 [Serpula lacrymans var. lacrymans S7.3]|uniref:Actin cytoskeleton-regulatory complex protein SLA1 n=1 Tax=Serpula lacrymans var. lacrymans (strain S7.3) TaxID=936435 RepID=F8QFB2_SERL3|nr:hypothetical protein SERLA73DRAFT_127012 [Serpula lacrymans var. lacrymans S7.3]
MAAESEEYLAVLRASYDYEPQSEDEIAIKENQMLFLLERTDDDWWKVKVRGETQDEESPSGLVPAAYVEQAEHTSMVKALYDYEASAPGELSVKEDEVLLVFDKEDDWILVQSEKEGGKAGFVPGNYVDEITDEQSKPSVPHIIIPPSPPPPARPVSMYMDPAVLVAAAPTKAQADDIKTWSVSEVNEKGKKKKGTLGVGNGAVFFASESDKTPVQKWQTVHIENISVEKSKHVHIEVGGPTPIKLHFNVGSKDTADAVVSKLESSKASSTVPRSSLEANSALSNGTRSPPARTPSPNKKNGVRFAEESPAIIPPREPDEDEDEEGAEADVPTVYNAAIALYDFEGTGSDELSVQEGEHLHVLEKGGDEWWKCRNTHGEEGVVPASYLESTSSAQTSEPVDDGAAIREREARLEEERAAKQRADEERERERKKQEQERRAKAAAAAAEVERKRREKARGPPPESTRIWHDRSGEFRVEAAFLGFSNGKLRLHKANGVVIEVPSEKMSLEDMRYVEKLSSKKNSSSSSRRSPQDDDDDDQPLALKKKQSEATKRATMQQPVKKGPQVDWFEFFLSAGCDVDDCTRYASSFERDKIDEAILPDITESTMRSLGLREGDIIRVNKVIQQKYAKPKAANGQLLRDEELAKQLQEEENTARKPPTNLFTSPDGVLKNNTQRRGRPQPSKSLPPATVDLNAITTASGQIQRTSSPLVASPVGIPSSPALVQPPQRSSSAVPAAGGFDDDAWTNRPGSKPPAAAPTPTPAAAPPRAPSAPPAPQPTPPVQAPQQSSGGGSGLAKTDAELFDQLARLSQLRSNQSVPAGPASTPPGSRPSPAISSPPPAGFNSGLGMGSSPAPMGQHLQSQQTGMFLPQQQNGPRGPFAPVPANQSLLQPLIPTTTGFNSFVPTRISNTSSPFQAQAQPQLPFLQSQPTGFPPSSQPLLSQPTGFPTSGFQSSSPMLPQPTGIPTGNFGNFSSAPSFQPVSTNPTGFNPSFSQPPPVPPLPYSQSNNTHNNISPANVFAQMKSGTFASGNDNTGPVPSDKYDALRANRFMPQTTGWGYQGNNGYQNGYTGY